MGKKVGDIVATKEQKQNKNFAEKLLRISSVDYDKWLDEKHQEVIQNNQSLILEALDSKLNTNGQVSEKKYSNSNTLTNQKEQTNNEK